MLLIFKLTPFDRNYLLERVRTGIGVSRDLKYFYVLLALHDGKDNSEIAEYYHISRTSIWRIKKKYLETGLAGVIEIKTKTGKPKQYSKKDEKALFGLSATVPPDGKRFWTVQLLIAYMEKNNALKSMNRETIRLLLKKNRIKLRKE